MEDPRVEAALRDVRQAGHRVTTARRVVLRVIAASGEHLTAEQILDEVARQAPDVHLATVYRNLDALRELGLVVHTHLRHGPAVYRLAADRHEHLVCERCGQVTDVPAGVFDNARKRLRTDFGFEMGPQHFAITGVCTGCS